MKVYLRVYKLKLMISPFVDMLQRTVCEWNHCSIVVDDIVIHFFDPDICPRWTTTSADHRLYREYKDIFVGEVDDITALREFTNKLPKMSNYDLLAHHLWYWTFGLWPKRYDCVDKCSRTFTHLFEIPRCTSTPDNLIKKIYAGNSS